MQNIFRTIGKQNAKIIVCFYFRFTHAALAFEGVGGKYRAVFAEPKNSTRTSNNNNSTNRNSNRHDDYGMMSSYGGSTSGNQSNNNFGSNHGSSGAGGGGGGAVGAGTRSSMSDYSPFLNNTAAQSPGNSKFTVHTITNNGNNTEVQLNIIVSSTVNQDQLWRLFDIVPGLDYCHITGECNRNSNYATAAYNSFDAAQYAR